MSLVNDNEKIKSLGSKKYPNINYFTFWLLSIGELATYADARLKLNKYSVNQINTICFHYNKLNPTFIKYQYMADISWLILHFPNNPYQKSLIDTYHKAYATVIYNIFWLGVLAIIFINLYHYKIFWLIITVLFIKIIV